MTIVFINGQHLPVDQAAIPITDRGFLFGEGIFTTIRVSDGIVECCEDHLERLQSHCCAAHIPFPTIKTAWIHELISYNHAAKGVWRLKIIITETHLLMLLESQKEKPAESIQLTLFPDPIVRPTAQIKSLAYLDRVWVRTFAQKKGVYDAIVRSQEGYILEIAFSNIFWRQENDVYTPDPELPLLFGVTISHIVRVAQEIGMNIHYVRKNMNEIPEDAQVYVCNAMNHFTPVDSIDKQTFVRDIAFEHQLKQKFQVYLRSSAVRVFMKLPNPYHCG